MPTVVNWMCHITTLVLSSNKRWALVVSCYEDDIVITWVQGQVKQEWYHTSIWVTTSYTVYCNNGQFYKAAVSRDWNDIMWHMTAKQTGESRAIEPEFVEISHWSEYWDWSLEQK